MGLFSNDDEEQKPIDPQIVEYFKAKSALKSPEDYQQFNEQYGADSYKAAEDKAEERKSGLGWAQFAAGAGDAIAGRSPSETASRFQSIRKGIDDDTVGAFMKKKDAAIKDISTKKDLDARDPNSSASLNFRKMMESKFPEVAKTYGDSWQNVSAADQENIFRPLQLKEQVEARKEAARALAGQRQDSAAQREFDKNQKLDEKDALLQTTYGKARTADDAKEIKEAAVLKKSFDNKIDELIALREKHGGGDILNRTDVARAKQLSKDLLLDYKSLSKLGVLSQSDMTILNEIIPDDPLQFRNPLEVVSGQDSTLSKMKSFKSDKTKDFENRLAERLRSPAEGLAKAEASAPSKHDAAIEWAMNHPDDPRSAKIMERNGLRIGGK